jgi:hypothetical protein
VTPRYLSRRTLVEALVTGLLATGLALVVFGPILSRLGDPLGAGDLLATYVNADAWGGFGFATTTHYGFPDGMNLNYAPSLDIVQNGAARLVGLVTGAAFLGINVVLLASFPVVAVLVYLLLRIVSRGGPIAIALALATSFLPYHFGRGLGHTYLATMYAGVTGVMLALLVALGLLPRLLARGRERRGLVIAGTIALVVLTAWSGLYYAAFAVILTGAALVWRVVRGDGWRRILGMAAVPAAIAALAIAGFVPALLAVAQEAPSQPLAERSAQESVTFAGSLSMALTPAPISQLPGMWRYNAAVSEAYADNPPLENTALTNYGTWVTTACALVFVVGWIVRARRREVAATALPAVGFLTAVTVLFFVPWGLNFIVASTVTAQVRAWNRLLPVLLVLLVTGAMAALVRTRADRLSPATAVAGVLITGIVLVEQVMPFRAAYAEGAATGQVVRALADEYAQAVNTAIPDRCGVLQLPYVVYPEQGTLEELNDYEHFLHPLVNRDKDFSYGAVKGTRAADLAAGLDPIPSPAQVDVLRDRGFCAIHVDQRGLSRPFARLMAAELGARYGEPVAVGRDGDWLLYDIRR